MTLNTAVNMQTNMVILFDYLESVSDIMEGEYMGEKTRLVYATFTTPDNAIGGNAVCAFKVEVVVIAIFISF